MEGGIWIAGFAVATGVHEVEVESQRINLVFRAGIQWSHGDCNYEGRQEAESIAVSHLNFYGSEFLLSSRQRPLRRRPGDGGV
jgi:hypothetical protein